MRIRILLVTLIRIPDPVPNLSLLMRMWIRIWILHPGSNSSCQIKGKNFEKVLKIGLLQTDADPGPIKAYHFDADADPTITLMRIRIRILRVTFQFDADPRGSEFTTLLLMHRLF